LADTRNKIKLQPSYNTKKHRQQLQITNNMQETKRNESKTWFSVAMYNIQREYGAGLFLQPWSPECSIH